MWLKGAYPHTTTIFHDRVGVSCNYLGNTQVLFLFGLPTFNVLTDHRPLEGIFTKDIFDLASPRLQRLREKVAMYSFLVRWVPGKTHFIADALSRAPLFAPEELPRTWRLTQLFRVWQ